MTYKNKLIIEAFTLGYKISKDRLLNPYGVLVAQKLDDKGYYSVMLGPRGARTRIRMHRLIAFDKFGNDMFNYQCVRHKNGNQTDNSHDNLILGTHSDNRMDMPEHVRKHLGKYAASKNRKLSAKEVDTLRSDRNNGMSYKQLTDKYGIAKSTVSYIVNNKTYIK